MTRSVEGDTSKQACKDGIGAALARIPSGLFVLTARHEDRRGGMLVSWVQQACFEPPMVVVAVSKGRPIMPLISESRMFGLCQIPKGDKIILRKFAGRMEINEDPFLGFELLDSSHAGVPILANVLSYVECQVACHMDVEGDHDLFVGRVLRGGFIGGEPHVHIRENGYAY